MMHNLFHLILEYEKCQQLLPTPYFETEQVRVDKTSRASAHMKPIKNSYNIFSETINEISHLEDVNVEGSIIKIHLKETWYKGKDWCC
jgi:hypothetical protein